MDIISDTECISKCIENLKLDLDTFLLVILVGTLFAFVYTRVKKKQRQSMEILKGPTKLPLIGSLHHVIRPGVDKLQVFLNWAEKYGSIYKVSVFHEEFVLINNPAMIQKVLSSHNPNYLQKHRFIYDVIFVGSLNNGLVSSDVKLWTPHRQALSKAFTFKSLKSHLAITNLYAKQMVNNLSNNGKPNETPFNEMLRYTVIKIILDVIIGKGICSEEEVHAFHENFKVKKEVIAQRLVQSWLLIKPIWMFHPLKRKLEKALSLLENFMQKATDKKRSMRVNNNNKIDGKTSLDENDNGTDCIMDAMFNARMSDQEILDEFFTLVAAGHETTCLALNFLFLHLALNPQQQELCRNEVDLIFCGSERTTGDELSMADVCELKHLERCVQETMRLTPIAPAIVRQIGEPIKLDNNIELDAGSNILISPWTLHRNSEIYPNPEKFDPNRFLPEECKNRHIYAYIPFSAGPRNCIGWKFAMIEIKAIAAQLLRHFEIFTEHACLQDAKLDFEGSTINAKAGFKLYFKRRNQIQLL